MGAYREVVGTLSGTLLAAFFGIWGVRGSPSSGVIASDGVLDFDDFGATVMPISLVRMATWNIVGV